MRSQLSDVNVMISQNELNTQRVDGKTKELAREVNKIQHFLGGDGINELMEKFVQEYMAKER